MQLLGRPLAELGYAPGINAMTGRNNHVQIIKVGRFSRKFGISEFSQCCDLIQFGIAVDIFICSLIAETDLPKSSAISF